MPWFSGFGTSLTSATSIANPFTQIVTSTTSSLYQPIVWVEPPAGWQTMYAQQAAVQQATYQQMMSQAQAQAMMAQAQAQAMMAAQQAYGLYNSVQRPASPQVQRVVEERRIAAEEAMARSRALLLEHLTPAQRETFEKNRWFVVQGGRSKRPYRIHAHGSLVANVDLIDSAGIRIVRLCAHCAHNAVPIFDQYLAQKIMLEIAEDDFLRVANRHP